jgi:hypothetical protein
MDLAVAGGRMLVAERLRFLQAPFLAVEGPRVKGILLTIPLLPSWLQGLLLRDAGVKVERPERSEDERP